MFTSFRLSPLKYCRMKTCILGQSFHGILSYPQKNKVCLVNLDHLYALESAFSNFTKLLFGPYHRIVISSGFFFSVFQVILGDFSAIVFVAHEIFSLLFVSLLDSLLFYLCFLSSLGLLFDSEIKVTPGCNYPFRFKVHLLLHLNLRRTPKLLRKLG
jgi:hypothetical protein